MWSIVFSSVSAAVALTGCAIAVVGFMRASRESDAKARADAAQVGLDYLERALKQQQDTITTQQGEIGELRGRFEACDTERRELRAEVNDLRDRLAP